MIRDCSAGNNSFQSGSNAFNAFLHLGLGQAFDGFAHGAPCLDDDFGGQKQKADLIDDDLFDLGGRNASNRTVRAPCFRVVWLT